MMMARKNVLFSLGRPNLSPLGTKFTSLPDFACSGGTHIIFGILNVKTKLSAYANEVLKKEAQNMVTYQRLICSKTGFKMFLFVRKLSGKGRRQKISSESCPKSGTKVGSSKSMLPVLVQVESTKSRKQVQLDSRRKYRFEVVE